MVIPARIHELVGQVAPLAQMVGNLDGSAAANESASREVVRRQLGKDHFHFAVRLLVPAAVPEPGEKVNARSHDKTQLGIRAAEAGTPCGRNPGFQCGMSPSGAKVRNVLHSRQR